MKKLAIVVGARPQFIKLAPLIDILNRQAELITIHTGQHYDFEMSDIFFKQLNIPEISYHLGIGSANHAAQVGKMMIELEKIYLDEKLDIVVVIGDTNSTLAGAVAAAKDKIPIAHVEAGLRSRDNTLPEQINRIVADRLSAILCCPDTPSIDNLKAEGITSGVYLTGDILYDLIEKIMPDEGFCNSVLSEFGLEENRYILMTIHRAENVDNADFLEAVIDGVESMDYPVILPLHPRTAKNLKRFGLYERVYSGGRVKVTKPVGIKESLALTRSSLGVITDSGGIQREAAYFGKKAYILRDETEWLELEKYGAVMCINRNLAGTDFNWEAPFVPREYFKAASQSIADCILESLK